MPISDQTPDVLLRDSLDAEVSVRPGESLSSRSGFPVIGQGPTGLSSLIQVDDAGRLLVSQVPPAPAGTAPVKRQGFGNVGSNGTIEDVYTITNGKTLVIQTFQGGGEGGTAGGRIELHVRDTPSTPLSESTLVSVGYIAGSNFQFGVDESFVGDGSRQVVLRRINQGGSSIHMYATWKGYES